MSRPREKFMGEAKAKGYELISYVSSKAILCENEVGENCFIMEKVNVQPFVKLGAGVVIWPDTHVGHHSVVEDCAWIGSGVVISGRCGIGKYAYLASGVLVDAEVQLAEGTLAGLKSVVKQDTEAGRSTRGTRRASGRSRAGTSISSREGRAGEGRMTRG